MNSLGVAWASFAGQLVFGRLALRFPGAGVALALAVSLPVRGVTVDDFVAFTYTNAPTEVLPCRLWVPVYRNSAQRYPLVLFLHGAGERGTDNRNQLAANPAPLVFAAPQNQANWPCFVLAPQCPAGQTWAGMTQGDRWSDPDGTGDFTANPTWTLTAAMAALAQLTNASPYAAQIDTSRLYVTGLSMGGYGSFDAICRWPGVFRAAVPICGGGDPLQVGAMTNTPVWAFHAADDPLVPVARSRQMIQALRERVVLTRLTEYPISMGIGHGAWVPAYADPDLLPWLFGRTAVLGGDGVLAEYFANATWSGTPAIRRVERSCDLDWDAGSPGPGLPADNFSVRLTTRLMVPNSGLYTFRLAADDRATLLIDGQTVISGSGMMTNAVTADRSLTNGLHDLEVDFVEGQGRAWLRLAWQSDSMPLQPLLEDNLFCPAPRVAPLRLTPAPGNYGGSQTATVATATAEAIIRYTTNGVPPTSTSPQYFGPLPISAPVTLRFLGMKAAMLDSIIASADYNISPALWSVPQTRALPAGTNWTLAVTATGVGPLRYQWSWDGMDIPGATNASLLLTNVQPAQSGFYRVHVMDAIGTNSSPPAQLIIAMRPVILIQPQSLTVLEGQEASLAVTASGTPPLSFRWRRGGTTLTNMTLNATNCVFTMASAQFADAGNYTVVVTNHGGNAAISSAAVLAVLSDFDRDGMADTWEGYYGFSTNSAADAAADADGDGLGNRAEYIAGTDPTNALSCLRIVNLSATEPLARLEFLAVSNRSYVIQFTDTLASGIWSKLVDVAARSTNRLESIPDSAWSLARFYRLATPGPN